MTHGRQDAERRRLRRAAERAGRDLDGAPAAEIVRWAAHQTGGRLAVAASMQDAVLAHLTSQVVPGVDVLFLDTGFHFAETVAMRGRVARELAVNVVDVRPRLRQALFEPGPLAASPGGLESRAGLGHAPGLGGGGALRFLGRALAHRPGFSPAGSEGPAACRELPGRPARGF